jgi:NAD(P)H dehydrogenase (quinone)
MLAMTGAGGKLGGAVAAELIRRAPAATVRLGTRAPQKLAKLEEAGVQVLPAGFDDPASLARLFEGCSVVLIISGDAPNEPRIAQHATAFEAAMSTGVGRIVYTSFTNATPESQFLVARSHVDSERMLRSLGPAFTILRNNLYTENIMIEAARATGELAQPGSEGRAAYIAYADVARATAGALLGNGHENRTYEITGPEALSHFEIAERLAAAWDRPIRVRDLTPDAYADALAQRGLPPFVVELLLSLHAAIGAGEYAGISPDAARLSGAAVEPASAFLARV